MVVKYHVSMQLTLSPTSNEEQLQGHLTNGILSLVTVAYRIISRNHAHETKYSGFTALATNESACEGFF